MRVSVGISNRHIHLNKEDFNILFGNIELEKLKDLKQPGEYSSTLQVTIKTEKNKIEKVRVMGPLRSYTQLEISKTDSYTLGINPPIRKSGDITNCPLVEVIGSKGIIKACTIIPQRHIHISKAMLEKYGLNENSNIYALIKKEKSGILSDIKLKVCENSFFELHLDTDDGNAFFLKTNDIIDIIKID